MIKIFRHLACTRHINIHALDLLVLESSSATTGRHDYMEMQKGLERGKGGEGVKPIEMSSLARAKKFAFPALLIK